MRIFLSRIGLRALILWFIVVLFSPADEARAADVRVAVASNFSEVMKELVSRFEASHPYSVTLSFGSTGKHYAQIKNGAPFDVFFAADVRRPKLLEDEGIGIAGTRFSYAYGRIVLWSPQANYVNSEGKVLDQGDFVHLALANPKLAPYGRAAQEVLEARGLWASLQPRLVRGENIGQAFQFVVSGNAALGFVSVSQIMGPNRPLRGSYWTVPQTLYAPIEQQAVLLRECLRGRAFLEFIKSEVAGKVIESYGYDTPGSKREKP